MPSLRVSHRCAVLQASAPLAQPSSSGTQHLGRQETSSSGSSHNAPFSRALATSLSWDPWKRLLNCIPPEALPSVPAGIVKGDPSLENLESSPPSG